MFENICSGYRILDYSLKDKLETELVEDGEGD